MSGTDKKALRAAKKLEKARIKEERYYLASQWQLMARKLGKHHLARIFGQPIVSEALLRKHHQALPVVELAVRRNRHPHNLGGHYLQTHRALVGLHHHAIAVAGGQGQEGR